ncbi:hypothetical protein [Pedobacter sp. SYSU D00535]|uniref:hypothetical protein n=1 Tax=Pedobacter sp. SYSU D00535 TaxID=2810308 RepID=UPI001A969A28|nr:hypothetical protein [Pedobacter sp. SYSU D00535]
MNRISAGLKTTSTCGTFPKFTFGTGSPAEDSFVAFHFKGSTGGSRVTQESYPANGELD